MTEQREAPRGTFVEDLGSLFEPWAYEDGREGLRGDIARAGAEEMARQFRRAEDLLEGLESAAEQAVGYGAFLVLGDAKKRAAEARVACERHARRAG